MSNSGVYLIESQYLPPVETLVKLFRAKTVRLEMMEHFVKASYRNRAVLLGANGPLVLSVPLLGGRSQRKATGEILIDNRLPWMPNHWNSIVSAYGRSPYFEHYSAEFESIFQREWEHLVNFNQALLGVLLPLCGLSCDWEQTTVYKPQPALVTDLRNAVPPFKGSETPPTSLDLPAYLQVFADRFDFVPNLSGLDLLFNLGPEAAVYLESAAASLAAVD